MEQVEKIDDTELGIGNDYRNKIVAIERMKVVDAIYTMKVRLNANRASMRANQTIGSLQIAKQFEDIVAAVKMRLDHANLAMKQIDKDFPGAKAKMIELYRTEDSDVKAGAAQQVKS